MSALPELPLSLVLCGHHNSRKIFSFLHKKVQTFAFENSPPLSEKCPHWTNFPHPECGGLLRTSSNFHIKKILNRGVYDFAKTFYCEKISIFLEDSFVQNIQCILTL